MLRIVLVEPREAGNVGAVARAMKNFGFSQLVIVGPMPGEKREAEWWSSGADDLIEKARFVPSLDEALADAHVAVATTSSRGRDVSQALEPAGVGALHASLADDQTLALVFGREDRGLTSRELALCGLTAAIPTNAAFPTMNLAQSAVVFCYEISRCSPRATREAAPPAPLAMVERLHERARGLLLDAGFLDPANPDHIYDEIRALAARAMITEREATLLLGAIRQLEWKRRAGER